MTLEPLDPFLFFRRVPHWRWLSFMEVGERLDAWDQALAGFAAGTRVAVPAGPSVEALVADIAARTAGLVPVPVAAGGAAGAARLEAAGVAAVLAPEGEPDDSAGLPVVRPAAPGDATVPSPGEPGRPPVGGCLVAAAGGWRELLAAELAARVAAVDAELGEQPRRPIVVHAASLAVEWERVVVEWAIAAGAAIVVEPDPPTAAGSTFWARPTILHGSAERLRAWTHEFARVEPRARGRRRRFARLRTVLVAGALDEETRDCWRVLGVPVVALAGSPEAPRDRL